MVGLSQPLFDLSAPIQSAAQINLIQSAGQADLFELPNQIERERLAILSRIRNHDRLQHPIT